MFGHVNIIGKTQAEVKGSEAIKFSSKSTKSKASESTHQNKKDEKLYEQRRRNDNLATEPGKCLLLEHRHCGALQNNLTREVWIPLTKL